LFIAYCFSLVFLPNFRSTETKIITNHITPKEMSTSLASSTRSNWDITSVNVEPPKDKGEPGMILGVGIGVGIGVGVESGVTVGSAGGGVTVEMGAKVGVGRGTKVGVGAKVGVG
jgi:hypothetical protein